MGKVFTITEGLENMGAIKTGGQGSVYKGRRMGAIITAVKLLPTPVLSESLNDKNYTDFLNEVHKLQKVNEEPNPNVVKILSSGITESGAFPFIEMEFIEGPDMEELLQPPHDPVFTIKETIKVAEQLSNALAHCHKQDVKHGDIKSNNVKFNRHTGNYVLLDFGLAIMSDEQRRTSLRHAGAIEFMAPEQNEGMMLFQTDVYGFGVVIFELLAGVVPFPLRDKGETSRNMVMVAHMETPPPDVLALRREHLPERWSREVKEHEMRVPEWLVTMIYKCLEKRPENRFASGVQLHEYIVRNSTLMAAKNEWSAEQVALLQQQNERLVQENEQLQQLLLQYRQPASAREQEPQPPLQPQPQPLAGKAPITASQKGQADEKGIWRKVGFSFLIGALVFSLIIYTINKVYQSRKMTADASSAEREKPRGVIGQYKVTVPRAYFHNEPDPATRRNAYMTPSNDVVAATDEKNDFIYTEFTNSRGQTSKGWLRRKDLITLEDWSHQNIVAKEARPNEQDINNQLKEARNLLANNDIKEALYIYSYLADQGVPEAMFQYSNMALLGKNEEIDCGEALVYLIKASDKGYAPAKRTLGFLYLFAENNDVLEISNYHRCEYDKDISKGTELLIEAVIQGDTTAKRLLDEINIKRNEATTGQD